MEQATVGGHGKHLQCPVRERRTCDSHDSARVAGHPWVLDIPESQPGSARVPDGMEQATVGGHGKHLQCPVRERSTRCRANCDHFAGRFLYSYKAMDWGGRHFGEPAVLR
jgi:hypothetical protein